MRVKFFVFSVFFCFFLGFICSNGVAQETKAETQVIQDFVRYLATQNGQHKRVDKNIQPWKLSEVYLNDSLWAKVTISDESRIAARQGLHGAGPQLKMDYRLTKSEFERIKSRIKQQPKTEWTEKDFPENTVVVQQLNLAPASHYTYSYPVLLPSKNLILVKRYFRAQQMVSRWSSIEVYRIVKPGKYKLENSYLKTYGQVTN